MISIYLVLYSGVVCAARRYHPLPPPCVICVCHLRVSL